MQGIVKFNYIVICRASDVQLKLCKRI